MEFALVDAAASKKQKRRKRVGFEGGNFVFCDSDADRKVRTNRIVYDIYTSIYTIYAISVYVDNQPIIILLTFICTLFIKYFDFQVVLSKLPFY